MEIPKGGGIRGLGALDSGRPGFVQGLHCRVSVILSRSPLDRKKDLQLCLLLSKQRERIAKVFACIGCEHLEHKCFMEE